MASRKGRVLYAYQTHEPTGMPIEPAARTRRWMDETQERFAYRCIPMVLANQAGWVIPSPIRFTVRWNGGARPQDLRIWFPRGRRDGRVQTHFGHGVLTFTIPYLFRTPEGVNLWVKGPANRIKDGAQPLEGIVETDWSVASFTMNWKLTRRDHSVRFEEGEPICMLVPVQRHLAEQLVPRRGPLQENRELSAEFDRWKDSRDEFNQALASGDMEAVQRGWQKDYALGLDMQGNHYDGHQTRMSIRPFEPTE